VSGEGLPANSPAAVARALDTTVYCDARKAAILRCQNDPELHAMLSTDPVASRVHLVPLGTVSSDRLKDYVARYKGTFSHAIAFRPTGWTFTPAAGSDTLPAIASVIKKTQAKTYTHADLRPMRNSTAALQLYGVPYSEHSSFFELSCFALSLDWVRIIATVNGALWVVICCRHTYLFLLVRSG
jgi:DNA cross-link repair 1A protein